MHTGHGVCAHIHARVHFPAGHEGQDQVAGGGRAARAGARGFGEVCVRVRVRLCPCCLCLYVCVCVPVLLCALYVDVSFGVPPNLQEELQGTRYQSGSFFLVSVGSGFPLPV
jgi:hypothetical protein